MLDSLRCLPGSDNDGFGGQSVPNCISPRSPFASFGFSDRCSRLGSTETRSSARKWVGVLGNDALHIGACDGVLPPLGASSSPLSRVCCQSLSATGRGSMWTLSHHAASSPWR